MSTNPRPKAAPEAKPTICPPTKGCPVCRGLGWIYTTKSASEGRFAGVEYPAVARCPCREPECK